jgi:hypothetical protein
MKRTSASILLLLLGPFKKPPQNATVRDCWLNTLDITSESKQSTPHIIVYRGIIKFDGVMKRFVRDFKTANMPAGGLQTNLQRLNRIIEKSMNGIVSPVSQLETDLVPDLFDYLEMADYSFKAAELYHETDEAEITNCFNTIDSLLEILGASNLDPGPKATIIGMIKDLKTALRDFKVFGDWDLFKEAFFYKEFKDNIDGLLIDKSLVTKVEEIYTQVLKTTKPISEGFGLIKNFATVYALGKPIIERIAQ